MEILVNHVEHLGWQRPAAAAEDRNLEYGGTTAQDWAVAAARSGR